MKHTAITTTKVILEFYMEIWYCYKDEGGSMADPLFTSTSYEMAEAEAKDAGYEVVQVIEFVDEEETSPEPSPIGKEVEANYYLDQLNKVKVGMTEYSPTIKVFANGNGKDTNHMSLNDESAKTLIQWLKNNFPNCED